MITAEEQNTIEPICPYCKSEIIKVWYRKLSGMLGARYIYFCSNCRSTLGISHRKGFWMG
jgi:hypothetical protein